MNKLAIITGTSRGLGLNLAEQLLQNGYTVIGIARTNSIKHPDFHFLKMDLSEGKNLLSKLQQLLKRKKISLKNESVVLINNAATVLPVNYFHKVKLDEIRQSSILNLQVPIFLSHFVINVFLPKTKFLTICNISSGAAVHALENWSMYCTMKSGLKMFTDCLNVDYSEVGQLKAFSFYPGVMDTQMQATIRQQPSKNFKNLNRFKELKEKNELLDPLFVSQSIVELLSQPQSIKQSEYDIKNFKRS